MKTFPFMDPSGTFLFSLPFKASLLVKSLQASSLLCIVAYLKEDGREKKRHKRNTNKQHRVFNTCITRPATANRALYVYLKLTVSPFLYIPLPCWFFPPFRMWAARPFASFRIFASLSLSHRFFFGPCSISSSFSSPYIFHHAAGSGIRAHVLFIRPFSYIDTHTPTLSIIQLSFWLCLHLTENADWLFFSLSIGIHPCWEGMKTKMSCSSCPSVLKFVNSGGSPFGVAVSR